MQNQLNSNTLYSFIAVPSSLQYFAFVPMSPSIQDNSTPTSETTFSSGFLNIGYIQQFCVNQHHSLPTSLAAIVESEQGDNPINIQRPSDNSVPMNQQIDNLPNHPQSHHLDVQLNQQNLQNSSQVKKQKKFNRNQLRKVGEEDKDYIPQLEKKKKIIAKYQDNQNRNVVPNEINQIFSFVQKENKSGYLIERLLKKYPLSSQFSVKRFYLYQKLLKSKLGHYTNQKSLKFVTEIYQPKCEIWPEKEQRYYNKLCRILIRHFLYFDSIFIILTSRRMRKQKKGAHLHARRLVAQSVFNILKG